MLFRSAKWAQGTATAWPKESPKYAPVVPTKSLQNVQDFMFSTTGDPDGEPPKQKTNETSKLRKPL